MTMAFEKNLQLKGFQKQRYKYTMMGKENSMNKSTTAGQCICVHASC